MLSNADTHVVNCYDQIGYRQIGPRTLRNLMIETVKEVSLWSERKEKREKEGKAEAKAEAKPG